MLLSFVPFAISCILVIACAQYNKVLPSWGSRKLMHAGVGLILCASDYQDMCIRYSLHVTTVACWCSLPFVTVFHFIDRADIGALSYVSFLSVVTFFDVPYYKIMPLFVADPMGAIAGRNINSVKLWGDKSLAGSLAVWIFATLTLYGGTLMGRVMDGFVIAGIELFAGKYDNPCIGVYLVLREMLT